MQLKDEKADEMRQWEGLKRQKGGKPDWLCDQWTIVVVCVCVSHPALDVGLLLLDASEGLLSHSQSIGRQFSASDRATKWEQFQNICPWQQWLSVF